MLITLRPLLAALTVAFGPTLSGCLVAPSVWQPSDEDHGVDTGPDPGTCEARHDCAAVPK